VPNESEFAALFGAVPDAATVGAAAVRSGCGLVVTLGEGGALVAGGDRVASVPSWTVPVVDTTGAGDAFVGGFAVGLARGWDGVTAARFGCACGALSVSKAGTQTSFPSLAEVEALTSEPGSSDHS
jgi:ribokinase